MSTDDEILLRAALEAAERDVEALRAEKKRAASPLAISDERSPGLAVVPRASERLANARQRLTDAKRALAVFATTGTRHGVIVEDGHVFGTLAVFIPPGAGADARQAAIEGALQGRLEDIARGLGAVLAARPLAYTREQPGRDAERRVVLVVEGRVEGDRLLPESSRVATRRRSSKTS
jgi:hypothetical protein